MVVSWSSETTVQLCALAWFLALILEKGLVKTARLSRVSHKMCMPEDDDDLWFNKASKTSKIATAIKEGSNNILYAYLGGSVVDHEQSYLLGSLVVSCKSWRWAALVYAAAKVAGLASNNTLGSLSSFLVCARVNSVQMWKLFPPSHFMFFCLDRRPYFLKSGEHMARRGDGSFGRDVPRRARRAAGRYASVGILPAGARCRVRCCDGRIGPDVPRGARRAAGLHASVGILPAGARCRGRRGDGRIGRCYARDVPLQPGDRDLPQEKLEAKLFSCLREPPIKSFCWRSRRGSQIPTCAAHSGLLPDDVTKLLKLFFLPWQLA